MPLDMNQFIRQIQKDNPVTTRNVQSKVDEAPSRIDDTPFVDDRKPPRAVKYVPPKISENEYNEKVAERSIPQSELADIKKTEAKLKKSKVKIEKTRRDSVNKVQVECGTCGEPEEFYAGQIIVTADNPHVCSKCLKKVQRNIGG
jgi:hypothetical protein